ncbi:MAG: phosphoribosylaminoimidazolesuccinocarboxamide synthase [Nitrospina sp.]|jgi:phosphoribosylaminoimidazole-succinocarboxamide synthase|nr:phosphoribosylaminoimidazolesuccinocarboxamide synthase [Nitrospina sp.]MBT3507916.1 phosphoribosylaminoimidazolesuccinocarboxamide synthase [Nitrospina sp.]MBT3876442.1 phosphoribosylaminoimidazolesuccinocarboxamide synthase [Nitrospina sp.]MBT4048737.1 phosphoribosylaminoimidazolesuccinocarboxamide synthase [Nitrospina sp.]MBT4558028.1 phosphoribosylaminoimidazolesuccinocarboxamide synthase [Nitrospina sp.]
MERLEKLYEGKAKILYNTSDPDLVIQYFKDDASAFDGKKKGTIVDKGVMNNHMSSKIFQYLENEGVETHFVKTLNDREMLVKKLDIIPVEVVLRNVAAGSLCKRLGIEEGRVLEKPILEFFYKSDPLGDPMINECHVDVFGWATKEEVEILKSEGLKINNLMIKFFKERNIRLVDFKLEFGRHKGKVFLGDEISPDGCRLWHWDTNEKMDKDRFRFNLGNVEEKYQEVYDLICSTERGAS